MPKKRVENPAANDSRIDFETPTVPGYLADQGEYYLNRKDKRLPRGVIQNFNRNMLVWIIWEYSNIIKERHGSAPPLDNEILREFTDIELELLMDFLHALASI